MSSGDFQERSTKSCLISYLSTPIFPILFLTTLLGFRELYTQGQIFFHLRDKNSRKDISLAAAMSTTYCVNSGFCAQ